MALSSEKASFERVTYLSHSPSIYAFLRARNLVSFVKKQIIHRLQISEVVDNMKDLMALTEESGTGPIACLQSFPRRNERPGSHGERNEWPRSPSSWAGPNERGERPPPFREEPQTSQPNVGPIQTTCFFRLLQACSSYVL